MQILKNYTSIVAVFIISAVFIQCGTTQKETSKMVKNPPFTITEATYQTWVAGIQGGGAGTYVVITFGSIDSDVEINNFYFGNFKALAKVQPNNSLLYRANVLNNTNNERLMNIDPKQEANTLPQPKSQFELEQGNAIIEYNFKGKTYFHKVTKMIEKSPLAYPSANPNGRGN